MTSIPRLARIRVHPIKALDPVSVEESRVGPGGGLEFDRVWALFTADGEVVNGKRTDAVHRIRARFARDMSSVTLSAAFDQRSLGARECAFPADTVGAAEWFSRYFDRPISVRHVPEGVPDDTVRNGPMVVSTGTLERVQTWFPQLVLEEVRVRFRAPLELDGVEPFWEDRLFSAREEEPVRFRIGDVAFDGTNPCRRCPLPARDSQTGEDLSGFQRRFTELRRQQLPGWAEIGRFEHFYYLGINTRVAPTEVGKILRLGDALMVG